MNVGKSVPPPVRKRPGRGQTPEVCGSTSSTSSSSVRMASRCGIPGHWHAKHEVRHAQVAQRLDPGDGRLRGSDDEAIGVQVFPLPAERVGRREDVALAPVDVRRVLGREVGLGEGERLLVSRGDARLAHERQLLRLGAPLGAEERELPLDLLDGDVRVDVPRVGEPRRSADG